MAVLGFLPTLLCAFVFEDKCDVCAFVDIVHHSNLLFLLQRLYISLPVSSQVLPISLCHSWVRISPWLRLTYFHLIPLLCDYSGKVNAAPAESALMLSCQPSPPPLRLIPPSSSITSSGHSQQRQPLAPTLTSHHFTRDFNSCPNKLDSSVGRTLARNITVVSLLPQETICSIKLRHQYK